ncbi:cytochrome P450 [Rickenella mellea]|uniref:Cytochrome P450 n=1 Tax=Rickenella mellea TaxID=50990 RepID=A0A4Y7PNJ7_9AGAM|nr:cytochrome P450 [Rickenella mellea]
MNIDPPLFLSSLLVLASWYLWKSLRSAIIKCRVNLPGPPRAAWFVGNLKQFHDANHGMEFLEHVASYGSAVKIHGICGDEQIYISDPRALHYILLKEQDMFEESNMGMQTNRLLFGNGLLGTCGAHHKRQRKMLNPIFSAKHMRSLTPLFYKITRELGDILAEKVKGKKCVTVNMLDWMSRISLEIVGQAGMGYSFEVFDERDQNEYAHCVRELIPTVFTLQAYLQFIPLLVKIGPPAFRRFLVQLVPSRRIQRLKKITDTIEQTSQRILETKKRAIEQGDEAILKQVGEGKDIISVFLRANRQDSESDTLPEAELLAHMSTLIFAAHDTTSSALSRILHMLCLHPETQETLRNEVTVAMASHGELSYDDIMALPYLDAVCRETLRLHPPVPFMPRTALRDTVIPLMIPVKGLDGEMVNEIPIAANQGIVVGIVAANKCNEVWGPDADEWKPNRWLDPLPSSVYDAHVPSIYSHTLTFLAGGRACIGFKFSELEMKIVIALLLQKFRFSLPDDEEIIWRLGSIQTPSTRGRAGERPFLPLQVSMV